jgi:hypothetical protein
MGQKNPYPHYAFLKKKFETKKIPTAGEKICLLATA